MYSVILGVLDSFRHYKTFCIIVPKILDAIKRILKVKIFLIPLSITFLNPEIILDFLFSTKNGLTLGVKCEKLNLLQKIVGNLFPKIVHEWNGHLEIFSRRWGPLLCVSTIITVLFVSFFYLPKINHHHNVSLITVLEL